jgi:XTP/dITP diphosphohydrolase
MILLLIATNNAGKLREYQQLLTPLPPDVVRLCTPASVGLSLAIQEDGATYVENARLKALGHARASGLLTLADDSGLEVDALSGEPGVHSARYAGNGASDEDRYRLLLQKLDGVPTERRTARFRCAIVLAAPDDQTFSEEGTCEGVIALQPCGKNGFGYDPIFYLPPFHATMAELSPDIKNRVSHRARAVQALLPALTHMLPGEPFPSGEH